MSPPAGPLAGSVRWAVVPYSPRPPFRLYAGEGQRPIEVPDADTIVEAAKQRGDAELTYLVPAKARPVLILSEPPSAHHREVTALRLLRLSKLTAGDQTRVREQREDLLFHLSPQRFDLPEENAAIVSALVRLHADAIGSGPAAGVLDATESRVLGERVIRFYGFDTGLLVERRIQELIARRRGS